MQRLITVAPQTVDAHRGLVACPGPWRSCNAGQYVPGGGARRGLGLLALKARCACSTTQATSKSWLIRLQRKWETARQLLTAYYAGVAEGNGSNIRQDDHVRG